MLKEDETRSRSRCGGGEVEVEVVGVRDGLERERPGREVGMMVGGRRKR